MRNKMSIRLATARKMALASIVGIGIVAPVAIGAETARLQGVLRSLSIPRFTDVSIARLPVGPTINIPVLDGWNDGAPPAARRDDAPPPTMAGAVDTTLTVDDAQVTPQPAAIPSGNNGGTLRLSKLTSSVQRQWFTVLPSTRWESTSSTRVGYTLVARGLTLRNLVGYAFGTEKGPYARWQVLGGPDWIDTTRFDVTLPIPPGEGEPLIVDSVYAHRGGRALPLLRQLLVDGLRLQVRQEQQFIPVSNLVKVRDGLSIKPSKATCEGSDPANVCDFRGGPGFMAAQGQTMHFFVVQLNWNNPGTSRLVLDKTGMTGRYDFAFGWSPKIIFAPNRADGFAENATASPATGWDQAVETHLGLQYQPANELVDVIVIESVQPLMEN